MNNFKIGDVLVGNEDNKPNRIVGGRIYTVKAVDTENGVHYVKVTNHTGGWVRSSRFSLHKEAETIPEAIPEALDDELPPAPESVLYREAITGNTLSARTHEWDNTVEVWSGDRVDSVCLSADETMQLAHDLTRMAMGIKRKEKQNG